MLQGTCDCWDHAGTARPMNVLHINSEYRRERELLEQTLPPAPGSLSAHSDILNLLYLSDTGRRAAQTTHRSAYITRSTVGQHMPVLHIQISKERIRQALRA